MGIHFLQFLRELSIQCHENNLVLSVDNPVPEDFTVIMTERNREKLWIM